MKYVKARPIGDLLREVMLEEGLESPLLEFRLIHNGWPEVVGEYVANHTKKLSIVNQVLFVQVDSSVVRQELSLKKTELVRKLNTFVDAYIISDIKLS